MVTTYAHEIETTGQGDAHDVTGAVTRAVKRAGLNNGVVTIFVVGSTAGVTTLEFEPGVVHDLDVALEKLAPRHGEYRHHLRWGDDNGSSHVRAAVMGPSLHVPFKDGELMLGQWQQVVVCEFDTRPRQRQLVIQIIGE